MNSSPYPWECTPQTDVFKTLKSKLFIWFDLLRDWDNDVLNLDLIASVNFFKLTNFKGVWGDPANFYLFKINHRNTGKDVIYVPN